MDKQPRPPSPAVAAALLMILVLTLVAVPDDLLSMRPPDTDFPFPASLNRDAPLRPRTAGNAVRLPVAPHAVRLPADKKALHPLDHPIPVRRTALAPGVPDERRTRVFAVNEPPRPHPTFAAAARSAPAPRVLNATPPEPGPPRMQQTASRTPSTPPPARVALAPQAGDGISLLVVGDSLSISLADVLERRLAGTPGLAFARMGKVSSGLARPDFFDWEATMERMAGQTRADIVVVMIGANDNKPVRLASGKSAAFGTPAWAAEYRRRAARLVEIARVFNASARVVWVGAPIMADPGLARDLPVVNAALAQEISRIPGCRFVDVWDVLAGPEGRYLEFANTPARTRLRAPDGVHLAPAGANRLADACLAALAEPAPNLMVSQLP
jgi:hypothetical protein